MENIKESKPQEQTEDLGQAETINLGQAGNPIKEEVKKETPPPPPPTDFKIAEIWIRSRQIMLDATPEFWRDKFRARGVIAYLDDIVRDAKVPDDKPKIIPGNGNLGHKIMNFAKSLKRRK